MTTTAMVTLPEDDQVYLRTEQYRDATNVEARIDLHERFSVNRYGWPRWVFDQLLLPPQSRVLELGCGPGKLWQTNLDRLPLGWGITLSDFSPGMVEAAAQALRGSGRTFHFAVVNAQSIPYDAGSFDAVIANHMLYHVPRRDQAIAEMHRVLRPRGRLYAATNGRAALRELDDLVQRFAAPAHSSMSRHADLFGLETGGDQLRQHFADVTLARYEDALVITDSAPLVAYIRSMQDARTLKAGDLATLRTHVEGEIAAHGAFRVTKDSGLFTAAKAS